MIHYNYYKLFNPDLKNYSNNQLLIHWKMKGSNENRICSLETFFNMYPYYDNESYKKYNEDLLINDKFDLMAHWHLTGSHENRLCSDKHFYILYPNMDNIDISNINCKNEYHRTSSSTIYGVQSGTEDVSQPGAGDGIIREIAEDLSDANFPESGGAYDVGFQPGAGDVSCMSLVSHDSNKVSCVEEVLLQSVEEINIDFHAWFNPNKDTIGIYIDNKILGFHKSECDGILRLASPDSNQVTCDLRLLHLVEGVCLPHLIESNNSNNLYENYFLKSLSSINYYDMNIIVFCENIKNIGFLKNINYFLINDMIIKDLLDSDCLNTISNISWNYIIMDNLNFTYFKNLNNIKNIFIPSNLKLNLNLKNIIRVNNSHLSNLFKNNILISEYDYYVIELDQPGTGDVSRTSLGWNPETRVSGFQNKIYNVTREMKGSIINNKIYINQSYIDNYVYENNLLYEPNNNRVNYLIKNFIREIEVQPDVCDLRLTHMVESIVFSIPESSNITNKIKTVLINLDDREDRLKDSTKECHKIGLYNFERFSAIKNVQLINPLKAWKKNINYIRSASGCKMSHLEILKKYANCSEEYIMILEDDVVFEENTITNLNLALISLQNIEWDILYLGTNLKKKKDAIKINDNLLKIDSSLTTTAQIFKKNDINKIIKVIEESEIEIDNTYNEYLKNKYCVYPMCVYQRVSYSDINKKIIDYGEFHKKYVY